MHNIPSGHEASLKPAGPANTDPGCWQTFKKQFLLVTDMAFDESDFDMNSVNKAAVSAVADAIGRIAHAEQWAMQLFAA